MDQDKTVFSIVHALVSLYRDSIGVMCYSGFNLTWRVAEAVLGEQASDKVICQGEEV